MGRDLERQLATEDRQMASKHVRRHSQPFVTMELQIRTRRCHHTQIKRGGRTNPKQNKNFTKLPAPNACECVKRQGLLGTAGDVQRGTATVENGLAFPYRVHPFLPQDPAIVRSVFIQLI